MKSARGVYCFFAATIIGTSCLFGNVRDLKRPETTVQRCKTPPVIDGDLSDPCWQKAVPLGEFFLYMGKGKTVDSHTVRMLHDDTWLYFAFDINLPHPEAIEHVNIEHDGPIHAYDSVEIFVDPGTDGEVYLHYMLGISNVRGERRCTERGKSRETMWNVPWRSATKTTETGWQAELAIPLIVLAEHGDLEKLALNIGVNRILLTLNEFEVPISSRREVSSWAPVAQGFHEPERFGRVAGLAGIKPQTPLLVSARGINTTSYQIDEDSGFFYEVSGEIQRYTDKAGTIQVVLEDKPGTGTGETALLDLELDEGQDHAFSLRMPVKVLSDRTANLTLRDPETGEILQLLPMRDMAGLSLMRSYIRYSYYTTEEHAEVVCELGLPAAELDKMKITIRDKAGKKLAEEDKLAPKTFIKVAIGAESARLSPGNHSWTVELQRETGDVAVSQEVIMVKREPLPGSEWKIDHGKGRILNNGEPFFPFGLLARIPDNEETMEIMGKDIADMGFNTVVRWSHLPFEEDKLLQLHKLGGKHGFYIVDRPSAWRFDPGKAITPEDWWSWVAENIWQKGAKKLMTQPTLMTWYIWDEPAKTTEMAELLLKLHKALHEADGYHPTEVLYIPQFPEGEIFSKSCDILGVDPYWVPGGGAGDQGNPNFVGRTTWLTRRRADRDLKLAWITPCAELWSGTRMRIFNENEQRVQTYLALIHGAQSLLYFVYPFKSQVTYDTFKRLGNEMKTLGPACAAGRVPQNITYTPTAFDPLNNIFTDVQASLKRNPEGGYILLAANWRAYPVEVEYTVPLLENETEVRHIFGDKPALGVTGSSFSDTFAPMDTRAYKIPGPALLAEPVEITVSLNAVPGERDRFYTKIALPDTPAPGQKNLLRNSGFEESSIPGMADYYHDIRTPKINRGYRIGDTRVNIKSGICAENPYEGRHSMRLQAEPGSYTFMLFGVSPDIKEETPFVFSAWIRGDTTMGFYSIRGHRFQATDEWQRVSVKGTVSPDVPRGGHLFGITVDPPKEGVANLWVDAMQFELGEELTDYEP